MLFERFEAEGLAHFSYAVGCPAAGGNDEALLVLANNRHRFVYGGGQWSQTISQSVLPSANLD